MIFNTLKKTKLKKTATIGRGKKALFDILLDYNLLSDAVKTINTSKDTVINVFRIIKVLHGAEHEETKNRKMKSARLRLFLERAKEQKKDGNSIRYSPAQQLQLASYLRELSDNCKNAAKAIEAAAKKDPHQNATFFEIETVNQFHKKKETAKTKEVQKSIFGNIIK